MKLKARELQLKGGKQREREREKVNKLIRVIPPMVEGRGEEMHTWLY